MAKILINVGETVNVEEPIAMSVDNIEEYLSFIENARIAFNDKEKSKEMNPPSAENDDKILGKKLKVLLREIRHLIQQGEIAENTEFAKELLSLARKGRNYSVFSFEYLLFLLRIWYFY